jgi:RHS repeat-associated protein
MKLPDTLTPGTWFADVNGDGRLDVISSVRAGYSDVWKNTGTSFEKEDKLWSLPSDIWEIPGETEDPPGNTAFADMDGDGLMDGVHIDPKGCPGGKCVQTRGNVWLNRIQTQGKWVKVGSMAMPEPWAYGVHLAEQRYTVSDHTGRLVDINGDGRADLVSMASGSNEPMRVILNDGFDFGADKSKWISASDIYGGITLISNYELRDVNRDGLPDLVGKGLTSAAGKTYLNTGTVLPGHSTVWIPFDAGLPAEMPEWMETTADFDGDGLLDAYQFGCLLIPSSLPPGTKWQDFAACAQDVTWYTTIPRTNKISLSNGVGYDALPSTDPRSVVLDAFVPKDTNSNTERMEAYNFVAVDVNADGLADLVQRIMWPNGSSTGAPGRLLFNTGTSFIALDGATSYKDPVGTGSNMPKPVPRVPQNGRILGDENLTFMDLDGDGVTDMAGYSINSSRNTFRPPTIKGFPNGLAKKTVLSYKVITTAEAQSKTSRHGHPVYWDSTWDGTPLATGTSFALIPLRVVESIAADDGIGGTATTDYEYQDMRASPSGRGPQGFATVITTAPKDRDQTTRIETKTSYRQVFPYTGQPWKVESYLLDDATGKELRLLSSTTTDYCDTKPSSKQPCTPNTTGDDPSSSLGSTRFVLPAATHGTSYLVSSAGLGSGDTSHDVPVTTATAYVYDDWGNPLETTVSTGQGNEVYEKKIVSVYGSPGSMEERLGKVTLSTVTTQRKSPQDCLGTPIVHTTKFEYGEVNRFASPVEDKVIVGTLGLKKTIVEPGAGEPIELHTAYEYDRFGNVIKTTACANEFNSCGIPKARGSSDLPYRITEVSYDPSDFSPPSGTGRVTVLPYKAGRFPVKTKNAAGHIEYTAYDKRFGALIQQTGPNGISTCKDYDGLGRQTSESSRCGTSGEITTTMQRFMPKDRLTGPITTIAVTTPPTGSPSWTYADPLGRPRMTLTRAFDSKYIKALTLYDNLGRVFVTTKPAQTASPDLLLEGGMNLVMTSYDALGRVSVVAEDLGALDGTATSSPERTTVTTTYDGPTVTTKRTVNGVLRTRSETKNALGKVASVTDANSTKISFAYDSDGNLRYNASVADACDSNVDHSNFLETTYDARGRRQRTQDPDMGVWVYQYDGFGDLVVQGDGKGRLTTMAYDTLGRLIRRIDDSGTSQWIYDVAPHGIGKLAATVSPSDPPLAGICEIEFAPTPANGEKLAGRSYQYTEFGDVSDVTDCVDGSQFISSYSYDKFGRAEHLRYPEIKSKGTRFGVRYGYTAAGYLHNVTDDDGKVLWAATAMNAAGQVTDEVVGNGVETASVRNDSTGWLLGKKTTSHAGGTTVLEDLGYAFDEAGNLLARQRKDGSGALAASESFDYDPIDRLIKAEVKAPAQGYSPEIYTYDDLGNLKTKAGTSYKYGTGCSAGGRAAGPHALCQIDDGPTYNYDWNGNLLSVGVRAVEWNASNMATRLTSGTGSGMTTVDFIYGADGQRVVQAVGMGEGQIGSSNNNTLSRTVYVGLGATGKSLYERTTRGSTIEHSHFVYAAAAHGGSAFAIHVESENAGSSSPTTSRTEYHHFDHLGSVTAVSDDSGHLTTAVWNGPSGSVVGYDPWGAIHRPDGETRDPVTFASPAGNRGFTDQEAIPDLGLVNMNGRIYDPTVGRFLSPDPNVPVASNLQSYNRYSYVSNNPLRYTDPTGYYDYERNLSSGQKFWRDYGAAIGVVQTVGTVVTDVTCPKYGPVVAGIVNGAIATAAARMTGSSWDDAVIQGAKTATINMVAGWVGGAVGGYVGASTGSVIAGGAAGGAVSGAIMSAGQDGLGWNVLRGAAIGAVTGAVAAGIAKAVALSKASAAEQQGGGTIEGALAAGGYRGLDPIDQVLFEAGYLDSTSEGDVLALGESSGGYLAANDVPAGRTMNDAGSPYRGFSVDEVRARYAAAYEDWWQNRPAHLRMWGPLSNITGGLVCEDYAKAAAAGMNSRVSIPGSGAYAVWDFQEPTDVLGKFNTNPGKLSWISHATTQVWMSSAGGRPVLVDTYDPWRRFW